MGNSALQGGGMNIQSSELICNRTIVLDSNRAERLGGGIATLHSSLELSGNTTLMGNSAIYGGGMGIESSELICNGTIVLDSNRAEILGGGLGAPMAVLSHSMAVLCLQLIMLSRVVG